MPIAIALGLATTFGMLAGGYDLILIPQNMVSSVKSIELTAIPFFILAAALMNQLGITRKIFDFAEALVGSLRGGLAQANVVAGFIFSGISGAAVADAAALAAISTKEMPKVGYKREFAAATVLAVYTLGPISFLLIANLLLLVLGCLVETLPAMLLAVPLLLPTALAVLRKSQLETLVVGRFASMMPFWTGLAMRAFKRSELSPVPADLSSRPALSKRA